MIFEPIAVISDIHGNSWALKSVLSNIKQRGVKKILNLGDSLYGPLDPIGTFNLLKENNIISISGNQDRILLENRENTSAQGTLKGVIEILNSDVWYWLSTLPFDMIYQNTVYCCHGTPQNDSEYLLESIKTNRVEIKNSSLLRHIVKNIDQKIIVCGHSHVAKWITLDDQLIANAGSVGLPAYEDDLPSYHKMENFTPKAHYIILYPDKDLPIIEKIAVDYDFATASGIALQNGRPDWANWLRSDKV